MIKLLKYLKNYFWLILIIVIFLGLQAYLQLMVPTAMGNITKITTSEIYDPAILFPNGWSCFYAKPTGDKITDILIAGSYMILCAVAAFACAVLCSNSIAYVGSKYAAILRKEVFRKVTGFSLGEFNKYGAASLITRTTNDIEQIKQTFMFSLRVMTLSPVFLIVAITLIIIENAQLALILAITVPILILLSIVLFIAASPYFVRIQKAIDKVTQVLRESLTGVRVIRAFIQEESEAKRFDEANKDMTVMIKKTGRIMSFMNPMISLIFDATYLGIYFYGFSLLNGTSADKFTGTELSNVIVCAQYAMQIMMSFMMFSIVFIMLPRASACAQRVNELLKEKQLITDPKTPCQIPEIKGYIEFQNVTFIFPDATLPTLIDISFKCEPGQTTAIIGSTGSGKSSVINLIPRFYDVSCGKILIDGVDVRKYGLKDLRNKIGFVPQQALLFTGTIKDNMLYGNKYATDEEINKALEVAQATHFVSKKENGIYSEVAQGGKNFSGGQKQRLSIARALVKKPEIYIFDDSFSALDFKTDIKLRTALKGYVGDATTIIVAQRVSTIMDADNIIVLDEGKIVGQGKHDKLLKTCKVYQEIVYSQMDKDEIEKTISLSKEFSMEGGIK